MKITSIKPFLVSVEAGNAYLAHRPYLFVKVETDEGVHGIGESGVVFAEWAVEGAIRHLEPLLIGQDPFRTEFIWRQMHRRPGLGIEFDESAAAKYPYKPGLCPEIWRLDGAMTNW